MLFGCVGGMVCTDVGGRLVGGNVVAGGAVGGIVVCGTGGSKVKEIYDEIVEIILVNYIIDLKLKPAGNIKILLAMSCRFDYIGSPRYLCLL